ncbi:MAG TPA: LamG-like jellyroll fold domain-containing protein, partial [Dissulfurispiraceae bacterium]|nr:LamG-like jellyroll fold domain-containing protein [Dissulfurispiraceae bacterium]
MLNLFSQSRYKVVLFPILILSLFWCPADIPAAPFAYVTNRGDSTISVIDIADDTVTSHPALSGTLLGVAINQTGTKGYFSRVYDSNITVLDLVNSNAVIGTFTAAATVHGIALNPDGTRLYVAMRDTGSIQVLDANTGSSITTISGMSNPTGLVVTPDGSRVYVANWGGSVVVVDTATNSVISSALTGMGSLSGIAVDPAGSRVYVYDSSNGAIRVIDTGTNSLTATITGIGTGDFTDVAVSPDGSRVYAGGGTNISVIQTSDNSIIKTISVGAAPAGIDMDPAGAKLYVTIPSANSVKIINTSTYDVSTITTGIGSSPFPFGKFIAQGFPVTNGLVSLWRAEENANDSIGSNNGTLHGSAGFTYGVRGSAFNLNGTDAYVDIANTASMDFGSGDFSISLWMNLNSLASDQELLHKSVGSLTDNTNKTYFVEYDASNSLRFRVSDPSTVNDLTISTSLNVGQWYHITAV